jgi:threonine/homoserine/homoserine lactone efflux protein
MTATSSHSVSAKDYFKAVAMALSNPGAILVMFALFAFFDIDTSSNDKMSIAPILFAVSAGSATYWFAMTSLINHFRKKFQISTMVWMNRIAGSIIAIIGLVLLGEGLFKVLVQGVPII